MNDLFPPSSPAAPPTIACHEDGVEQMPELKPRFLPQGNFKQISKMEVVNEGLDIACSMALSGSETSVSSMVSSSSTDSCSISLGPQQAEVPSFSRRKIFSQYWQKYGLTSPSTTPIPRDPPRSPLLEHYPGATSSEIPRVSPEVSLDHTDRSKEQDLPTLSMSRLSGSPSRRSVIFGATSPSRPVLPANKVEDEDMDTSGSSVLSSSMPEIEGFLSTHKHMTFHSASLDTFATSTAPLARPPPTSTTTLAEQIQIRRRTRSYSCSDANTGSAATQKILASCLRRRNSHNKSNQSIHSTSTSSSRLSVTFDSQISIVAFEPSTSCNVEYYTDGSWADVFDH